jgi:translation initiation factor 2B subunit (eIF-2B alpha/beta/delta family)
VEEQSNRLDRTKVTSLTFNEAEDHRTFWLDKTEDERLNAACYIINQIFGVTPATKVDRSITDKRKQP